MEQLKILMSNLKTWQKVAIPLAILLFLAAIVVGVVVNLPSEPKVKIEFSEGQNIPTGELRKIRENLSGTIERNTENFDKNVTYVGQARDYEEEVDGNTTTAIFIVDFDAIKQSYSVLVTWPDPDDGSPNIYISCPILDSKYPETKCVTEANSSTDLIAYLPYSGSTASGVGYGIVSGYNDNGLYLTVKVESCGDNKKVEEGIEAAKEWISSLGINPDDYLFFAPTDICNGKTTEDIPYSYVIANHAKTNDENVNKYLPYFIPNMYNVYPVVDESNNVTTIKAEISGCTDYQADPMEEQVHDYLNGYGISYPVEFEYCVDF
ncbi:hypothetical protein IKF84_02255 [Candidatus Saccharibacteria bacterium]|nr:hypothetical protein [Candidatus Saccharibacteria bacterium]